eukprot:Nitzschia sp. Nitz4//scaffold3_size479765//268429//273580//NITZ4_000112-RA/size479765-snap-gene-1.403-mRNA-1//-1//CDS//3329550794//4285//frame0
MSGDVVDLRDGTNKSDPLAPHSLEMRRLTQDYFLRASLVDGVSILSEEEKQDDEKKEVPKKGLLEYLCLRPEYSLRTQLMLSFGTISAATIAVVVLTCVVVAVLVGNEAKDSTIETFEGISEKVEALTAEYLAESLSEKILMVDVVNVLAEVTLDRFAGYPQPSDEYVPFHNSLTGLGQYPLEMSPMPLEWQFEPNVNDDNYVEHLRTQDYYRTRPVSTAAASYFFPGICDPNELDATADTYMSNCTDANNDISAGGVYAPTTTNQLTYDKSKDLTPVLKALFETRSEIRDLGIGFVNDGAGSFMTYPHYLAPATSSYVSDGCDWMSSPNPYNASKTIGTQEMIDRCSPKGKVVPARLYNVLERNWCIREAINPGAIFYDAYVDAWDNESWIFSMGRGLYDRITSEFFACLYVGVSLNDIDKELRKAVIVDGDVLSLVVWDNGGSIVGCSDDETRSLRDTPIYEAGYGLDEQDYLSVIGLVDFDTVWDPSEVKKTLSTARIVDGVYSVNINALPPVPPEYDPNYRPVFMVVVSTPLSTIHKPRDESLDVVDKRVQKISVFSAVAGVVGLVASFVIIYVMAGIIARPLKDMNLVASEIVSNFGDPTKEHKIEAGSSRKLSVATGCTPATELGEVVKEFNRMVQSFGGSSMAKTERHNHHEVLNVFTLHQTFKDLYNGRSDGAFKFQVDLPQDQTSSETSDSESFVFLHSGTNLPEDGTTVVTSRTTTTPDLHPGSSSSSLFLWIMILIVTPMLVVTIAIMIVSLYSVTNGFEDAVKEAETYYLTLERSKLMVHSHLRASLVSSLTTRATSDLHVLTRYAEWLVFGGVDIVSPTVDAISVIEECKVYEDPSLCPAASEIDTCDCDWNDMLSMTCEEYQGDSRYLQQTYWIDQYYDTDENGDRTFTSYPNNSYSPMTTGWWSDMEAVPGWTNSSETTSGYQTTYDRLKAGVSIPLFQPLYNHNPKKDSTIAPYVAFERDGLFIGYDGCRNAEHVDFSFWSSTEENEAAEIRPELCPLGKYGYDPRCRGWYQQGKEKALSSNGSFYVTGIYAYATPSPDSMTYAQTATAPMIDPDTNEYVGQVLVDFFSQHVQRVLINGTVLNVGGFPVLVTVDGEADDTVIGPNYSLADPPTSIIDKVLAYDVSGCEHSVCVPNIEEFEAILKKMKAGEAGGASFNRTTASGGQELVHIAFAPVGVESLRALNSSDFSRGLISSELLIYSLALAETEEGMMRGFAQIEETTDSAVQFAIAFLSTLLVLATTLVGFLSRHVARSITEPLVYLLETIKSIRKEKGEANLDFREGSTFKEIETFADSMDVLSVVVKSANTAFHAGEFEVAYLVLVDSLRLFRRLGNKKATGIACNNLGNVLMGMYQEMKRDGLDMLAGLSRRKLIAEGITCYHEAIRLGEAAYDEFNDLHGWTPDCLEFMQHLSNRYFNRGLFLLSVRAEYDNPSKIEEQGKRDLQIAQDMDSEVIAYGEDIGWDSAGRIERTFEVMISRANGYNLLCELGHGDVVEVENHLKDTFTVLLSEMKRESSILFARVSPVGRMQELETEIMKYYRRTGNITMAAKVAIRCLYEDEKIFLDTQAQAIDVLLEYVEQKDVEKESSKGRLQNILRSYADMLENAAQYRNATFIKGMENEVVSKSTRSSISQKRKSPAAWNLHQSCGRFASMEDF